MNRHGILLLAAVGVTALGCSHQAPPAAATKVPEVYVALPVTKEVTDFEEFTGRTEASQSIDIRARVTGYLNKVAFKEGTNVKEGDLLFEIDPRSYQAEYDRTEANLRQSEAHLARLERDFQRAARLLPQGAIGQEEYDRAASDRDEAAAAVKLAKAQRTTAELNLKWTQVKAPITGRISRQNIDPGNLVKADDTVLTTLVALEPIFVYYDVDERSVMRFRRLLKEGKVKSARDIQYPVYLGLADEEGAFPHPGTINFVDNRVDPTTGTLRIRGVFPNTDNYISPGQFARVRLPIGSPHSSLLVSERALGTDQGQKFLYVVNGANKVVYRKVTVGTVQDGLRVIEDGLAPGERVVVNGLQRVRQGVEVEPKLVPMTGQPAAALTAHIEAKGGDASSSAKGR